MPPSYFHSFCIYAFHRLMPNELRMHRISMSCLMHHRCNTLLPFSTSCFSQCNIQYTYAVMAVAVVDARHISWGCIIISIFTSIHHSMNRIPFTTYIRICNTLVLTAHRIFTSATIASPNDMKWNAYLYATTFPFFIPFLLTHPLPFSQFPSNYFIQNEGKKRHFHCRDIFLNWTIKYANVVVNI